MTANGDEPSALNTQLRMELLSALEREGIIYPPERLDEALVEYAELKRLMQVVEAATRPSGPAGAPQ